MPKLMWKRKDDDNELPPNMEEQRRYRCVECRREFRSPKALHGHMRVHPAKGYRKARIIKNVDDTVEIMEPDQELDFEVFLAAEILMAMKRSCDKEEALAKPAYRCTTCGKSFDTHQALGGHVASHNKHRRIGSGEAWPERAWGGDAAKPPTVHRCDKCGQEFASGVALGGHKSKHFHERRNAAAAASAAATARPYVIDLNISPADEDEGAN